MEEKWENKALSLTSSYFPPPIMVLVSFLGSPIHQKVFLGNLGSYDIA